MSTQSPGGGETTTPRIAVIGCGAISENFHLPALARHPELLRGLTLVDPDPKRARALADRFGVASVAPDYRDVLDRVDGVIVAVPHHLHEPIGLACLSAGRHVLCEKPLAETPDGVSRLLEAARGSGVALLVNQTRRLFPSHQLAKRMIEAGELGALRRITYTMGEPFEWPAATGSYFGARGSCKGVLLDTGAHILDLVCWWLADAPRLVGYRDDSFGGTEAVAQIDVQSKDCVASVRLSWLSKLDNRFRIEGEQGRLEGGAYDWGRIEHTDASGRTRRLKASRTHQSFEDFAARLIDNFVEVLRGRAEPLVDAQEVLASVSIIDACYRGRQRFEMPWQEAWRDTPTAGSALR